MPHECSSKGCTMIGIWMPQINIRAPKHEGEPAGMQIGFAYCELHKRMVNLESFLTDYSWKMICEVLEEVGKVKANRSLTTFSWVKAADFPELPIKKEKS